MARVRVKNRLRYTKNLKAVVESVKDPKKVLMEVGQLIIKRTTQRTRQGKDLYGRKLAPLSESYVQYRKKKVYFKKINGVVVPFAKKTKGKGAKKLSKKFDSDFSKYAKFPKPDSNFFRPAKSNLTFTGQLLRSLRAKVFNRVGRVDITFKGTRAGTRLSNRELARLVQSPRRVKTKNGSYTTKPRVFFGLTTQLQKQINSRIIKAFRAELKKRGFKRR